MKDVDDAFTALIVDVPVAVSRKPAGGGWQAGHGTSTFRGYCVVHPGTGTADGSLADGDRQIDRDYQVTCVAATADGAARLADGVIAAVRGQRIATETRVTTKPVSVRRYGSVDTDDTVQPPVFMVAHIFSVVTVPADPD